jgi:hypothetical protein
MNTPLAIIQNEVHQLARTEVDFVNASEALLLIAKEALKNDPPLNGLTDLRAQATAIGAYLTRKIQSREARLEAGNNITESRLRIERAIGSLIKRMQEAGELNGHGGDRKSSIHDETLIFEINKPLTIADVGISKNQSYRWQTMAALPEERFEEAVLEAKENGWELTSNDILQRAKFDYKRDGKTNHASDEYIPQGFDACQTPAYALDPLLPYLKREWAIWEAAAGEHRLVEALYDAGYSEANVIPSDLLTGQNFFEYEPDNWDCLVTNPPYSLKYKWLERCYALGKPFALLVPVETLGSKAAQDLIQKFGFEMLLLDSRVDFEMPNKGFEGSAQFPVMWLCWRLLPQQVLFGSISEAKKQFKNEHN